MKKPFKQKAFTIALSDCIRQASCELPEDIELGLKNALKNEDKQSTAHTILETIIQNINLAKEKSQPICQDTGLPAFYISYPPKVSPSRIKQCIEDAIVLATEEGYLRPNAVDPLSGKNSGNNLGDGIPALNFDEWDKNAILVKCMLKGGGSENVSAQYSLPCEKLSAGRDLKGVAACVIDAVQQAQGKGCAPGIIGVGLGGDRISGYESAKKQLFRNLNDQNENPELNELEQTLLGKLNKLEIGPMGLGGKTTVLGVKIGKAHRIPASYFISIAYMCWACRRKELLFDLSDK
ncbi:MAG: fumarate hydratase [Candidatus Marinimicrobia bacterium]|nr:fumarate hydratase [Candidatus Neomarinimicrobiota bacterium]